jgi:hypothetical protein
MYIDDKGPLQGHCSDYVSSYFMIQVRMHSASCRTVALGS